MCKRKYLHSQRRTVQVPKKTKLQFMHLLAYMVRQACTSKPPTDDVRAQSFAPLSQLLEYNHHYCKKAFDGIFTFHLTTAESIEGDRKTAPISHDEHHSSSHFLHHRTEYHALYETSSFVFEKQTLCNHKVVKSVNQWENSRVFISSSLIGWQTWQPITKCLLFENETWCFVPTMVSFLGRKIPT